MAENRIKCHVLGYASKFNSLTADVIVVHGVEVADIVLSTPFACIEL